MEGVGYSFSGGKLGGVLKLRPKFSREVLHHNLKGPVNDNHFRGYSNSVSILWGGITIVQTAWSIGLVCDQN